MYYIASYELGPVFFVIRSSGCAKVFRDKQLRRWKQAWKGFQEGFQKGFLHVDVFSICHEGFFVCCLIYIEKYIYIYIYICIYTRRLI